MKKAICLFFCLLVMTGCSDPQSKFRGEFLAGCIKSSGNKNLCKCQLEKLESQHGDQLATIAPSQLLQLVANAALECRTGNTSEAASQKPATDSYKTALMQALTAPNSTTSTRSGSSTPAINETAPSQALETAISEQVHIRTKYAGGSEYRYGRKIIEADFNGDQFADAVVLYTVEGAGAGNAIVTTLALFFGNQENYFAQGSTVVDGASDIALSDDGSILVTSLMHGPDDPDCCPSMKSTIQYRVEGNQILPTQ
jgi:hypothetical protein